MAENLQVLKKRIKTSQNIAQIAKAMEMIAASKIKRAQAAVENNRPYAQKIAETVKNIMALSDVREFDHPYVRTRATGKKLMVVFSPDKGLCGGLPGNVFRALQNAITPETIVIAVGKKAGKFAARLGNPLAAAFTMGTSFPAYGTIYPVMEIINQQFPDTVTQVDILYTEFKSMLSQTPVVYPLLPVVAPMPAHAPAGNQPGISYLFEPSPAAVLRDLLPRYVEAKLYSAMIQAFTSEQAARMIAMQNAKDNALDISDHLTNRYNRSRQERITNEILDLANGAA
ncbi:MAG: ATP synthase F1 subunit gamma [Endomicrobiales bacterium]|jgi:F-type H+-transporting ATPase subunit gamma